jgi:heme-degrading monooxygenase HmoA
MSHFIVRHKVEDYAKWKKVFDEHSTTRKTSGSKGGRLFRNADNPNEVIVLWDWEDLDQARQFAHSPDLRETMERAGVADRPDIYFLEEAERVSV